MYTLMQNLLLDYCITKHSFLFVCLFSHHHHYRYYIILPMGRVWLRCRASVAGLIHLVCMPKCPWESYWTLNCSWSLCMAATTISAWMYVWITFCCFGQKHLLNVNKTHCFLSVYYWYYYTMIRLNMTIITPGPIYVFMCIDACMCVYLYMHVHTCVYIYVCLYGIFSLSFSPTLPLSWYLSLSLFTSFPLPTTQKSFSLLNTLIHDSATHTNTQTYLNTYCILYLITTTTPSGHWTRHD